MGSFFLNNHLRVALALMVSTVIAPVNLRAGESQTDLSVQSNDANAAVYVDGRLFKARAGESAIALTCKAERRLVKLVSSDGQEFVRMMPSISDLATGQFEHSKWNVNFRRNDERSLGLVAQTSVNVVNDQAAVLRELAELRSMVKTLLGQKHEGAPIQRAVSNVEPGVGVSNNGLYVQIMSIPTLRSGHFSLERNDQAVFDQAHADGGDVELFKCPWLKNSKYTRVMLGPVPNQEKADELSQAIGRDSFVVRDPTCGS